jgi:hypothetical protein
MTTSAISVSQQKAARVAGIAYLLTFALVVYVNFGIHDRLIVSDAAQTARNIIAHESLFRIGIACDLLYCVGVVVLLTALYVILKPVSRGLALLAAFWRLVYALMWVVMTLYLFSALSLLNGADYARVFEAERLQALSKLYLSSRFDVYYVGLLFYGLTSAACAYLFFKSRYLPRALAVFGLISSAWAAICTIAFVISPSFAKIVSLWWFDSPLGIFEIATGFWLLFKGLRSAAEAKTARASS